MSRLMTGAYAPEATCKHGLHPYDCTDGCDPHCHCRDCGVSVGHVHFLTCRYSLDGSAVLPSQAIGATTLSDSVPDLEVNDTDSHNRHYCFEWTGPDEPGAILDAVEAMFRQMATLANVWYMRAPPTIHRVYGTKAARMFCRFSAPLAAGSIDLSPGTLGYPKPPAPNTPPRASEDPALGKPAPPILSGSAASSGTAPAPYVCPDCGAAEGDWHKRLCLVGCEIVRAPK